MKIFKTTIIILISTIGVFRCEEKEKETPRCQNNILAFSQAPINVNILNPDEFIKTCPLDDPNIQLILNDFQITINGQPTVLADLACTGSYTQTPDINDPLIWLQTLRFLYYLDIGQSNYIPWTNERLYDWLRSRIKKINVQSGCVGGSFDFETINVCASDAFNRNFDRKVEGVIFNISLLVHEGIHAIPESLGHSSCCSAGSGACDEYYDPDNIGAYGGSLWYQLAILRSQIDINLSVLSEARRSEIQGMLLQSSNQMAKERFCGCPPKF